MSPASQSEQNSIRLLEALKDGLRSLDDLRVVPHNDTTILRLKQHLRARIRELEGRVEEQYFKRAA